jgi:hypothetical protein
MYLDNTKNAELDRIINGEDTIRFITADRIRCLGHIRGMELSRMVKIIVEWFPVRSRRTRRPRIRWLDEFNDMKVLNV